jgi:hypothetical protein
MHSRSSATAVCLLPHPILHPTRALALLVSATLPQIFFPTVYDIKYLMKFCDNLHGGLNKLAETLDVARIGPQHQVRRAGGMPGWHLLSRGMLGWVCVAGLGVGRRGGRGSAKWRSSHVS